MRISVCKILEEKTGISSFVLDLILTDDDFFSGELYEDDPSLIDATALLEHCHNVVDNADLQYYQQRTQMKTIYTNSNQQKK